jgi:tripartite-type tricarboxylate transporter receptor subunit TctC
VQLRAARSNKGIKFVAVTSKDRFPGLPEVPPISATLAGYDQPAAMGLMTTKGTPAPIVAQLNRAIQDILKEPEIRTSLIETVGGIPVGGSVDYFRDMMTRQREARGPLLQELGLIGK